MPFKQNYKKTKGIMIEAACSFHQMNGERRGSAESAESAKQPAAVSTHICRIGCHEEQKNKKVSSEEDKPALSARLFVLFVRKTFVRNTY